MENRVSKDKSKWEITTAHLTGIKEHYEENVGLEGYHRVEYFLRRVKKYNDYQITYNVEGKKYTKYVTESEARGRKRGKVRIRYLKNNPTKFEVLD